MTRWNAVNIDPHQPVGAVDIPCSSGPSPTRLHVIVMPRLDFSWKCRDCGITSRKEPHRRLSDHMMVVHDKVWSDDVNAYVTLPELTSEERALIDAIQSDAVSHWLNGELWDGCQWIPSAYQNDRDKDEMAERRQ